MAIKKSSGKSIRMTVTPNVEHSIKILKKAVKALDNEEVIGAIKYLEVAAKGETQPMKGRGCPKILRIQKEL